MSEHAKYNIGDIVSHSQHYYRGVIVDIDPCFQPSGLVQSLFLKYGVSDDEPWYRILVDRSLLITYVSEKFLEIAHDLSPIDNPKLVEFLCIEEDGSYVSRAKVN